MWVAFSNVIPSPDYSYKSAKKPVKPPKPPPDDDPVISQPAFAYYGKANPNSGAVYLANADGSEPVKIFTTAKFQGDRFEIASFQGETAGSVLVIDSNDLWRIDYDIKDGNLGKVHIPEPLITGGRPSAMDWNPDGSDFAFHDFEDIYLGSRVDYDTGVLGSPIVLGPASPYELLDHELLMFSPAWSADGLSLYFIKWCIDSNGPWWERFSMASTYLTAASLTCLQLAAAFPSDNLSLR